MKRSAEGQLTAAKRVREASSMERVLCVPEMLEKVVDHLDLMDYVALACSSKALGRLLPPPRMIRRFSDLLRNEKIADKVVGNLLEMGRMKYASSMADEMDYPHDSLCFDFISIRAPKVLYGVIATSGKATVVSVHTRGPHEPDWHQSGRYGKWGNHPVGECFDFDEDEDSHGGKTRAFRCAKAAGAKNMHLTLSAGSTSFVNTYATTTNFDPCTMLLARDAFVVGRKRARFVFDSCECLESHSGPGRQWRWTGTNWGMYADHCPQNAALWVGGRPTLFVRNGMLWMKTVDTLVTRTVTTPRPRRLPGAFPAVFHRNITGVESLGCTVVIKIRQMMGHTTACTEVWLAPVFGLSCRWLWLGEFIEHPDRVDLIRLTEHGVTVGKHAYFF